ncbi:isocitrate lyase/PEP mutase family protein [Shimia abyssi]|uniref:2-methylisocitrate lyase-like PEP mutase family enzyme n=1 Tax=Shimia abyssi TaxID=1662395 RepID=A0A2P8FB80_9RHOB|nr:isocitrate lyase/phosphoenolpyruvate mutase family protein [Shimia abyssi]PSL18964.1 2-methylisocitrate lyase-like PEP mutase family enzyme [Shimia abyssi]
MNHLVKFESFKALHAAPDIFVMPNPWDAGTARLLTSLGFPALATTSAGFAFAEGRRDACAALSRDEVIQNAAAIVAATELPVSADLEDGFGMAPEACAETIRAAIEVGLVGGSIEDATGDNRAPIIDIGLSAERICAAAEAAKGRGFLLTARAENHLWGRDDLLDTIRRLQKFSEAGADVLYAPGLPDLGAISTVCREVDKPVNVVMGLRPPLYSVSELAEVGVKRVSVGGSFARAAFGAVRRAAMEVLDSGSFTYAEDAMPGAEIAALMSGKSGRN